MDPPNEKLSLPMITEIVLFGEEIVDDSDEGLTQIPSSAFDATVAFRGTDSNQENPSFPLSNLFDGDFNTMWFPKDPVSEGYYNLKPFIQIAFKNGKEYRIDKVRIYGRIDEGKVNAQFPENIKIATSSDGTAYTDITVMENINIGDRPSINFTYTDIVTKYLGIEVSEGWMDPPNEKVSLPMITEIVLFGEEVEVVDNNNLNNPAAEENLDKNYVTDSKNNNITVIGKIEEFWGKLFNN